jgi:hypothetical protein
MLHIWLLPALLLLVLALAGLYFVVRCAGCGDGVRKDGRCVCDRGGEEERSPES